ncbi:D-alanyl-D-alanine carboxypeptidase family protein [Streptomyces sp. WZ-12]|uniref:D-alanyl-D-alanine carboxypeptidase family protein n=1 Tax=Streptomyces sp. WZ-12 TaxID=3030210 RepID=UPI0023815B48|nr:serine hydrolase [Streptomyces sp. WZ-12]
MAQLTNRPPPPMTPSRAVAQRLKIWSPFLALLGIMLVTIQTFRPLPHPVLRIDEASASFTVPGQLTLPWPEQGQAAVQLEGTGMIGTYGEQKPVPTASIAKVMTAYVLLREHPLGKDEAGPTVEVDARAVEDGKAKDESRIEGLTVGQKFSQQDMLKMLMIPSGNNIARLLARWATGSDSEAAFIQKMNDAAKELGMKDTAYTDPSGLDDKTVSTAVDQLKLAEAVMKFDVFRAVVAIPKATIGGLGQPLINNMDDLLLSELSVKGIKTGSNTAAGGTLLWAAYRTVGDKTPMILGTMLNQHVDGPDPNGANSLILVKENSKKIVQAVRDALTSTTIVRKGQTVGYLDDGLGRHISVVAADDLKAIGVPGMQLNPQITSDGKKPPHSARTGTEVGVLSVGNGQGATKVPVALKEDLTPPSFTSKLTRLQ